MISFTLCSNNYLAQAKVLGDSFLEHHPDSSFFIGLIDGINPELDYSGFNEFELIPVKNLPFQNLDYYLSTYNIIEFNTFAKPFYFQYLMSLYPNESVLYLDPDIKVYANLSEIEEKLKSFDVVLTPHLLNADIDQSPQFEQLVLNVGIYNLGFLGLSNTENAQKLLQWWADRLSKFCYIDFKNGLFVDQIWANLIPIYFDKIYVLKGFGYNMGYWNFSERKVTVKNGSYFINDTEKLYFFHFSSYSPLMKDKLCKWLNYSFEERPDLVRIYEEYALELINNDFSKFVKSAPLLKFKSMLPSTVNYSTYQKFALRVRNFTTRILNQYFKLSH